MEEDLVKKVYQKKKGMGIEDVACHGAEGTGDEFCSFTLGRNEAFHDSN